MNISTNKNSSLPPSPKTALVKEKSPKNLNVSFATEEKNHSPTSHEDNVVFLKELKENHESFFSSTNSNQYFDAEEGPGNKSVVGEQTRSIKKVNPRAEMTSAIHQINLKTQRLIRAILETLAEARKTYLNIPPPLEKTYSNFKWEETKFDQAEGKSIVSKHQIRVPVKRLPLQATPLTEEQEKDLKEILIQTKRQLEEAKELNQNARQNITENHLVDCREPIVSTATNHFNQFPELEFDLRELQGLLT